VTHISVIANDKGGVAKSQVVVHLAAALARAGKRVLVVDMDPQANATRRLGIKLDRSNLYVSVSEVIKADAEAAGHGHTIACRWINDETNEPTPEAQMIDVLPSRQDLVNRESEAAVLGSNRRLRKALSGGWLEESYDVVLIDTQPTLGPLTQMSMTAAHTTLIPVTAAYDAFEGALRVRAFVEQHASDLANPDLHVGGVIITRYRAQLSEEEFQAANIREEFGDLVWRLTGKYKLTRSEDSQTGLIPRYIPEWTRFGEADSAAASLTAWNDLKGRQSVAVFDALARTYIARFLDKAKEQVA